MKLSDREMSAFLMYRMIRPETTNTIGDYFPNRIPIRTSAELENHLKKRILEVKEQKIAIALSGGIDSAILASFMPKGSIAYTFKCVVPGLQVIDETPVAAKYAEVCGLEHRIVEVYWEDFQKYSDQLMAQKGAPIHSIEVQIYKAALQAKKDGIDAMIFGEAADAVYGGQSNILSREWRVGEFVERFSYIMPYRILKNPELPIDIVKQWEKNGFVDPFEFMSHVYIQESVGSYLNAVKLAGLDVLLPYAETFLDCNIDYTRIRSGDNKYMVREVFQRVYPDFPVPPKTPMPRPMNEWLINWTGPKRNEFWPNCVEGLTGDQKKIGLGFGKISG